MVIAFSVTAVVLELGNAVVNVPLPGDPAVKEMPEAVFVDPELLNL
jgi:hypothetical protein